MKNCKEIFVLVNTKGGTNSVKKCSDYTQCIAPDAKRIVKSGLYKSEDGKEIVCPHGNDTTPW